MKGKENGKTITFTGPVTAKGVELLICFTLAVGQWCETSNCIWTSLISQEMLLTLKGEKAQRLLVVKTFGNGHWRFLSNPLEEIKGDWKTIRGLSFCLFFYNHSDKWTNFIGGSFCFFNEFASFIATAYLIEGMI